MIFDSEVQNMFESVPWLHHSNQRKEPILGSWDQGEERTSMPPSGVDQGEERTSMPPSGLDSKKIRSVPLLKNLFGWEQECTANVFYATIRIALPKISYPTFRIVLSKSLSTAIRVALLIVLALVSTALLIFLASIRIALLIFPNYNKKKNQNCKSWIARFFLT